MKCDCAQGDPLLFQRGERELPDCYRYVAQDLINRCKLREGVWVDLGSGWGGLALALAQMTRSVLVLVDPDIGALRRASLQCKAAGLGRRVLIIAGRAENLPLADHSADLVVSRGSVFFWEDQPTGLREVYRILRRGGKAVIGGGLGSLYPQWARKEFIRRRLKGVRRKGPAAVRRFRGQRKPSKFTRWAHEAELNEFELLRENGLGIWLAFEKKD